MFVRLPLGCAWDDDSYAVRVARSLDRRRLAAAALVTLLLSVTPLFSSESLEFFSPTELGLAWLEHFVELAVIAAALTAAYTLLDEALPRRMALRLGVVCLALLGSSAVLALLLYAYYGRGFEHLPPTLRLLADSMRWGLPAVFLALVADMHRRALQADSAARAAELSSAQMEHSEGEQQLALLQAQIEPHFLFNVLGNVRRLYRTRQQAGADAIASLMRYLRTALPQVRSRSGCLGDEIELVRSYLDLFQVRMGARLTCSIEADPALHPAEFPPMLLLTLVENAIRHGLEPAGGGHVQVRAQRRRDRLEVAVLDDGAGFGAAPSGGTGVGLANVRRQLAAHYQHQARLTLEARDPRGASAGISIPWRAAQPAGPPPIEAAAPLDAANLGAGLPSPRRPQRPTTIIAVFARWLRTHRGAAAMAGLLSFAAPITFFTGDVSVMREPTAENVTTLGLWWLLYGLELCCLLLVIGYAGERWATGGQRLRGAMWLLSACVAAACVSLSTAARAQILVEQGVAPSVLTVHLHAFTYSLIMALLYFAHLRRSRTHDEAAARLGAAQAAQRKARSRMMQAHLQAVQARIDPQLLFEMLDSVRHAYQADAARAEQLLDELIAFLRAALPRLRTASSSVPREAELARVYARLRALAGATGFGMTVDVAADVVHARFPPGVLLPLLDDALRERAGPSTLAATHQGGACQLVLTLPVRPSDSAVARVRSLLAGVYGASTDLSLQEAGGAVRTTVTVPYELA